DPPAHDVAPVPREVERELLGRVVEPAGHRLRVLRETLHLPAPHDRERAVDPERVEELPLADRGTEVRVLELPHPRTLRAERHRLSPRRDVEAQDDLVVRPADAVLD